MKTAGSFVLSRPALIAALLLSTQALTSHASTSIDETVPEFSGPAVSSGFPLPPIVVGVFTSIPADQSLASGSISGTFGNSFATSSAGLDLFLGDGGDSSNDVLVAQCVEGDSCFLGGIDPWSYTLDADDLDLLDEFTGPLVLTAIQTSQTIIRLGPTQLVGTTRPVPEPTALALLAPAMLYYRRRRRP